MKIYSIDANISAGKSTLLNQLKDYLEKEYTNIKYIQEPVDSWLQFKDLKGESILEKFYKDPQEHAFSFQMMAYISRIALLRKTIRESDNNDNVILLTERSVLTDKNVFAQMLYDDGHISEIDYKIYLNWFDEFIVDLNIDGIIYLDVDIDTICHRLKKRNRDGENIPREYLQRCKDYHEKWLNNINTPILKIDYSRDFADRCNQLKIFQQIEKFLNL